MKNIGNTVNYIVAIYGGNRRAYGEFSPIDIFIERQIEFLSKNPKYIEFNDEYSALLSESKDIKVPSIKLSELDKIETEENYNLVLKYLVESPAEEVSAEEVK
jgi:hypothetical protein